MANTRREAIHNPIGDTAKRLARAYEKLGVSDQERLIPYHMSSVYWRFMEMLDTGANANMIKKEMVRPYVEYWYRQHHPEEYQQLNITDSPKLEIISKEDAEQYKKQVEQKVVIDEKINSTVENVWVDVTEYLKKWISHPFLVAGFHDARRLQGGGIGDALMRLGTKRDEKKEYYASWYGRAEIIRISGEVAPSIYFVAGPGMGKTNGMHLLIEEMFAHDYWVYTNMPVVAEYANCYVVRKISDLFIDTPEIPHILRSFMWARRNRRSGGSFLVPDEGGMGREARSTTTEGRGWRNILQVRRHLRFGVVSGGVQRPDPKNEEPGLLDILIEPKRIDTGKNRVESVVENGRTIIERKPIYKYYWDVATRSPNGGTNHELVYNIPFTALKFEYANEFRMPYVLENDIIDYSAMQKEIDFVRTPIEELIVMTREFVRNAYRNDVLGEPYFDDEDTMSKQEKVPAVKQNGSKTEVGPDIIEAIGELRKQKLTYKEIAEEMDLKIGYVVKVCTEHGWV
jgi:hypothetical protein